MMSDRETTQACAVVTVCERTNPIAGMPFAIRGGKYRGLQTNRSAYVDLMGKRFGQLLIIEKTGHRDYKGSVMWKCRCDCGMERLYSEDELVHHRIRSCGCYRINVLNHNLNNGLHRTEGTCLERLGISKARADSRSGHVGIYITINGHYRATIGFQGKRYNLGTYSSLEEAIRARKRGEELHLNFLRKMKGELLAD